MALGRERRVLNPSTNPVHAFAVEMDKLRASKGSPSFIEMARTVNRRASRTALYDVTRGDHLPKWETVKAFLEALDEDPQRWYTQWQIAEDASTKQRAGTDTSLVDAPVSPAPVPPVPVSAVLDAPSVEPSTDTTDGPRPALLRQRTWWVTVVVTAVLAGSAGATVATVLASRSPAGAASSPSGIRAIEVQNKIAIGTGDLIEDPAGPAYLSTRPAPWCARDGCKVAGTDLGSGARLVVTCHVTGSLMTNYNMDSEPVQQNPNRVRSTLWYRAAFPDGRTGYLSEVYIAPQYRGGMGLPICPT